jgi:hypothetical protein
MGRTVSLPPLELSWSLPEHWLFVPLDAGDLEAAVEEALDESAERDPLVMAAYAELRQMLLGYARARAADGSIAVLVRWGATERGDLLSAYVSVDRYERGAGDVGDELEDRLAGLLEERPDDHAAPFVDRISAPLGKGLRRHSVVRVPAADDERAPGPEVERLALHVEIWLRVQGRQDELRFDLTSFQVGHAALLAEELGLVVGSLEHASGRS